MNLAKRKSRLTRRFLVWAGFIFLAAYFGILGVQWALLRTEAVEDAQDAAKVATQLFVLNLEAEAPLSELTKRLHEPAEFRKLDELIRHKLGKFGLQKCRIYDRDGTILYADEPALVGKRIAEKPALRAALSGRPVSNVLSKTQYTNLYGAPARTAVVDTYLPMVGSAAAPIRYVFEAYQNFDPAQTRIRRMVLASAVVLALILGFALTALTFAYRRIHALEAHVETLEGLLPICSYCKKIRVKKEGAPDRWVPVERYFGDRDRMEFTHSICDTCMEKKLSEGVARKKRREREARDLNLFDRS